MIITISGPPGSGKSGVAKALALRLGLRHYSVGDLRRRLAREQGLTIDEYNRLGESTDETDRTPDEYQARLGREEDGFIIDSRLGFHFIPQSFKVRLDVDPWVGAERIFRAERAKEQAERHYSSGAEVRHVNEAREASDHKRYQMYYGISYEDDRQYDLIVDTTNKAVDEVVDIIAEALCQRPRPGESHPRDAGG